MFFPAPLINITEQQDRTDKRPTEELDGWKTCLEDFFCEASDTKSSQEFFRSRLDWERQRLQRKQQNRYIIHPFSSFRWLWDLVIITTLGCALVLQPVELAFFSHYETANNTETGQPETVLIVTYRQFWLIITLIYDAIFMLDIIVNFRTATVDPKTETIVLSNKVICFDYLTGWFFLDFLTSVPFDELYQYLRGSDDEVLIQFRLLKLMKVLSMIKVLRIIRLVRYMTLLEDIFQIEGATVLLFHLVVVSLIFLHWNACIQYLVPFLQEFPDNTWVEKYDTLDLKKQTVFFKYSASMYRSVSTVMRIGWGVYPRSEFDNIPEIWLNNISFLVGKSFFTLFVAAFKYVEDRNNVADEKALLRISQTKEYLRKMKLPKDIQLRVIEFYTHIIQQLHFDELRILFDKQMSPKLREEIMLHNCRAIISKAPFLQGCSREFLEDVVASLHFLVFIEGDEIIRFGEVVKSVYFIDKGCVEVTNETGQVEYLYNGDYFGDVSSLLDEKDLMRVVAHETCDVYVLHKKDLQDVLMDYPEVKMKLTTEATKRMTLARMTLASRMSKMSTVGEDDMVMLDKQFQLSRRSKMSAVSVDDVAKLTERFKDGQRLSTF